MQAVDGDWLAALPTFGEPNPGARRLRDFMHLWDCRTVPQRLGLCWRYQGLFKLSSVGVILVVVYDHGVRIGSGRGCGR